MTIPAQGFRAYCAPCGWLSAGIDVDEKLTNEKRDAHNNIVHEGIAPE